MNAKNALNDFMKAVREDKIYAVLTFGLLCIGFAVSMIWGSS